MARLATEFRKSSIMNMDETNIQLDFPCKKSYFWFFLITIDNKYFHL